MDEDENEKEVKVASRAGKRGLRSSLYAEEKKRKIPRPITPQGASYIMLLPCNFMCVHGLYALLSHAIIDKSQKKNRPWALNRT